MGFFSFVGDAISDITDPFTGADKAQDANNAAIAAQREMAGASNQTIRDMYQTGRQDQLPYMTPSLSALPMYQSAVLGSDVEYMDPRYQRLTSFDPDYGTALQQFRSTSEGAPQMLTGALSGIRNKISGQGGAGAATPQLYRTPEGGYTDKPPMLTAKYDLQQDPGFNWRNKQLDRSLRSLGRSNSTYGMQAQADFSGSEYDRSLSRLSQLAGFGQGTAGNVAQQGSSAAGQIAGVNTNLANSLSSLYGKQADLYTNYSPLNLGLNAAKVGAAYLK